MEGFLKNWVLFSSILDFGKGSKLLNLSKEYGCYEGTIFLGRGTVRAHWLNILGAMDLRKEIFVTILDKEVEDEFYSIVEKEFDLHKSNHGIAFSIPLKYCVKINEKTFKTRVQKRSVDHMGYECIFTIVDKGLSGYVLDAAESAGSTGGTIIHGRGTGSSEKAMLFDIKIEPEKDIILILSKADKTEAIVSSIEEALEIKEPGKGIVFVMDVSKTLGLYQG